MTEISLDSQKDVQFLKSNISLATREKLDIHLPPTAVPNIHSDTLRKRVEEMLDEVAPVKYYVADESLYHGHSIWQAHRY
jgi:kinetochor protein Mis14/NSL1